MNRRLLLAIAIVPLLTVSKAKADGVTVRWDIIHFTTPSGIPNLASGGIASARAEDSSKITFTGSGTFQLGDDGEVTGGGTWNTYSPVGAPTGSGKYVVTGLIKFDVAPGSLPLFVVDHIGILANTHAGLAFLRIRYDDGSRGVLVVSCNLPVGGSAQVFEGVTASKGYVDYWNHELATAGIDADRTVFHITASQDD
jgi:hypothetical protein